MDSNLDSPETDQESADPPAFRWPVGWGVMLLMGWLTYELTAQPPYGIAVTCAKFMWNDIVTGWWWFRRDPWRSRGGCGMLLVWCRGLFKYSVSAVSFGVIAELINEAEGDLWNAPWYLCLLAGGFAMSLMAVFATVVGFSAIKSGVRLWLDGELYGSRVLDQFPPPKSADENGAIDILAIACMWQLFAGMSLLILILQRVDPFVAILVATSLLLAHVIWTRWVNGRMLARTPDECWGAKM